MRLLAMRTIYASSLANFSELSRRPSNDRTADRDKVLAQINALVVDLLHLLAVANLGHGLQQDIAESTGDLVWRALRAAGIRTSTPFLCLPACSRTSRKVLVILF